jgi:hypothetical protein
MECLPLWQSATSAAKIPRSAKVAVDIFSGFFATATFAENDSGLPPRPAHCFLLLAESTYKNENLFGAEVR